MSTNYSGMDVKAAIGVTRQAMWKWDTIPPTRVPGVSKLTGIPKHELRPDLPELFPKPRSRT